jgi:hypothetical protein
VYQKTLGCRTRRVGISGAFCGLAIWISCFNTIRVNGLDSEIPPRVYSVELTASVEVSPPRISLSWRADPEATSYSIFRKLPDELTWGPGASLPADATNYVDSSVQIGTVYQYQVVKGTAATLSHQGFGYINAAIQAPLVETRGTVILMVDQTIAPALARELAALRQDLIGDGWTVIRHDVSRETPVPQVKAVIKADYDAAPASVKTVFLFGHIPVPYSGDIEPDEHPNHRGAWAADVYYGEMDGAWTDSTVISTNAERDANWNVPGDGKFDQSTIPTDVELEVGRVDLSNLTDFANKTPSRSEVDLLRLYLNKDHNFRHGKIQVPRRGIICDNFPDKGEDPVSGSAWRSYSTLMGPQSIVEVGKSNYFPTVTTEPFLWGFGAGGGTYISCDGIGSSDDFALNDSKVIFTMFMGSYFGDWDKESAFLRSAIASTSYTLTCSYSGFPNTLYFPMALGKNIGYCIRLTQNNGYRGLFPPHNQGTREIHIGLHGDPTLRMHPVLPPSALIAATNASGVMLSWQPSSDESIVGYHLYRAASGDGPFVRVTGDAPLTMTTFIDQPPSGAFTYMVRAIKLEQSGSGTYYNPSQGIFAAANSSPAADVPLQITGTRLTNDQFHLTVTGQTGESFRIESSTNLLNWGTVFTGSLESGSYEFEEQGATGAGPRFYRIVSDM